MIGSFRFASLIPFVLWMKALAILLPAIPSDANDVRLAASAQTRDLPLWAQIPGSLKGLFLCAGFIEVGSFTLNLNNYRPHGSTRMFYGLGWLCDVGWDAVRRYGSSSVVENGETMQKRIFFQRGPSISSNRGVLGAFQSLGKKKGGKKKKRSFVVNAVATTVQNPKLHLKHWAQN